MERYRIEYPATGSDTPETLTLDTPNIRTALIVAEMNVSCGAAQIYSGTKRLATIERRGNTHPSYWIVS